MHVRACTYVGRSGMFAWRVVWCGVLDCVLSGRRCCVLVFDAWPVHSEAEGRNGGTACGRKTAFHRPCTYSTYKTEPAQKPDVDINSRLFLGERERFSFQETFKLDPAGERRRIRWKMNKKKTFSIHSRLIPGTDIASKSFFLFPFPFLSRTRSRTRESTVQSTSCGVKNHG